MSTDAWKNATEENRMCEVCGTNSPKTRVCDDCSTFEEGVSAGVMHAEQEHAKALSGLRALLAARDAELAAVKRSLAEREIEAHNAKSLLATLHGHVAQVCAVLGVNPEQPADSWTLHDKAKQVMAQLQSARERGDRLEAQACRCPLAGTIDHPRGFKGCAFEHHMTAVERFVETWSRWALCSYVCTGEIERANARALREHFNLGDPVPVETWEVSKRYQEMIEARDALSRADGKETEKP